MVYQWLLARTLAVCQSTGLPVWFFATDPEHQEVQKLARRALQWYIDPIVAQQNEFNQATLAAVRQLAQEVAELQAKVNASP